jgi:hypothetical protein
MLPPASPSLLIAVIVTRWLAELAQLLPGTDRQRIRSLSPIPDLVAVA